MFDSHSAVASSVLKHWSQKAGFKALLAGVTIAVMAVILAAFPASEAYADDDDPYLRVTPEDIVFSGPSLDAMNPQSQTVTIYTSADYPGNPTVSVERDWDDRGNVSLSGITPGPNDPRYKTYTFTVTPTAYGECEINVILPRAGAYDSEDESIDVSIRGGNSGSTPGEPSYPWMGTELELETDPDELYFVGSSLGAMTSSSQTLKFYTNADYSGTPIVRVVQEYGDTGNVNVGSLSGGTVSGAYKMFSVQVSPTAFGECEIEIILPAAGTYGESEDEEVDVRIMNSSNVPGGNPNQPNLGFTELELEVNPDDVYFYGSAMEFISPQTQNLVIFTNADYEGTPRVFSLDMPGYTGSVSIGTVTPGSINGIFKTFTVQITPLTFGNCELSVVLPAAGKYTVPESEDVDIRIMQTSSGFTPPMNPNIVPTPSVPSTSFADVTSGDWYYNAVNWSVANGIFSGYSDHEFGPNDGLTRAQAAVVLAKWFANPYDPVIESSSNLTPFGDVPDREWYTGAINWCYAHGITSGVSANAYGVNDQLNREQMCVLIQKCAQMLNGSNGRYNDSKFNSMADKAQVSGWAVESVGWALDHGVVSGVGTGNGQSRIDATGTTTRAQMAQIMKNSIENNTL